MQTTSIPSILPPEGFQFPIENSSTPLKFFPLVGIARGGSNAELRLYADRIEFKVVLSKAKSYSIIELADIETNVISVTTGGYSQNIVISFKDSIFAYRANIREKEDLIELIRFFCGKSVSVSDDASSFIEHL